MGRAHLDPDLDELRPASYSPIPGCRSARLDRLVERASLVELRRTVGVCGTRRRPGANARLVAHHAELRLARMWGGGELATIGGLRFVVPAPAVVR